MKLCDGGIEKGKRSSSKHCSVCIPPETFGIIVRHMMKEDGRVKRNLSLDDDVAGHGIGTTTPCAGADPSYAFSLLATTCTCVIAELRYEFVDIRCCMFVLCTILRCLNNRRDYLCVYI